MKKIYKLIIIIILILPLAGKAEGAINKPSEAKIIGKNDTAILSWKNPESPNFSKTIIFRSNIPIENYFTYNAVFELCDNIYEGNGETYNDANLAENLPYYYILFAADKLGNYSDAVVLERKLGEEETEIKNQNIDTLVGAASNIVNEVSFNEAGIVYNYNQATELPKDSDSRRLSLFIIVKSPHKLEEKDKNAISYFIHSGTPTTIFIGAGERAGVLNSYLSVFDKLPRNILEWQDVIKIANGRWPNERSLESEEQASNVFFNAIYERKPDMNNSFDNAAVTVIAYGLRPAERNLESEKNAIKIYRSIFEKEPTEAIDWDLVRAIAYSGATR